MHAVSKVPCQQRSSRLTLAGYPPETKRKGTMNSIQDAACTGIEQTSHGIRNAAGTDRNTLVALCQLRCRFVAAIDALGREEGAPS